MNCLYCGAIIEGKRKSRKFCNDAHKQAYWRKQHQGEQSQELLSELEELREKVHDQAQTIEALEQETMRLHNRLDLERRFHGDHSTYSFLAWLKKQSPSALRDKLLASSFLPARASRAKYEAHLRYTLQCSPEEMDEFAHLWKLMLLS
ncbi:hypothetical protein [Dictyobacter formicarum]|uniref:Recombinase zinc beta ribbon domain-containing protein n=1 Tax=Dictyobacter formicarum TaxID=2778368 RepID=A0ABQ3VRD5_9CHLR|nr:hypothetical protein [Dictyobacter formicarum]GHO88134.1 hypothetical protein KSZ_61400 [Dictyobacter formicarum]GHO88254.1 hypothetical protein KSZ_62600 [Dictyobacter formicarum]